MLTETGPSPAWEWDGHKAAPNTVLSYSQFFTLESRCEKKLSLLRGSDSAEGFTFARTSPCRWNPQTPHGISCLEAPQLLYPRNWGWISPEPCAHRFFPVLPSSPVRHLAPNPSPQGCTQPVESAARNLSFTAGATGFLPSLLSGGAVCLGWIEARYCAAGGRV